jgi:iron complex outermembrane receptor protein
MKKVSMFRPLAVSSCAAVLLAPSAGVTAQEAADSRALQEITVTARRTQESMQSVPISVTAFDSQLLRESTITTPEDIQLSTPGVFLSGSGGRQNVLYNIRGQSKALSGTSSPAVVSYFAEVPDPVWGSFVPQYDMASVQVLKGPQGTLFGRNTTGGALLYEPRKPDHEFGGYVMGAYGNYDNTEIQAAVNIPIVEGKAALRLAANIHDRDGYTENLSFSGDDLDEVNSEGFRASLLLEPTDYLSNLTIYDYHKSDTDGFGDIITDIGTGFTLMTQLGLQGPALQQLAIQKARGPRKGEPSIDTYEYNEHHSVINRTELDIGNGMQLVNIFGYRNVDLSYATNVDGMPTLTADGTGAFPAGFGVNFINADLNQAVEQFSNELQLKGTAFNDRLDWLLGLFWLESEPDGPQGNSVAFAQIVNPPVVPLAGPAYNFIEEKSQAVFAHFTYDLGELVSGLDFEVGLRYTEDEIESCTGIGTNTAPGKPFAPSDQVSQSDCLNDRANIDGATLNESTSQELTWSVGFNWQMTDDIFTYIVSRHGYRAGGVNAPTFSNRLSEFQSWEPETVTDVELGIRADWRVGEVDIRSNISAFIGEYKDVQTVLTGVQTATGLCNPAASPNNPPGVSPDGDCITSNDPAGGTLLVNLGESEVSGVDMSFIIAPTANLTMNLGASFLDPDTKEFDPPGPLAPYVGASGIPFNFTAEKTAVAGIRYAYPMDQFAEEIVFNVDYYWTDDLLKGDIKLPSYEVTNARVDINDINRAGIDLSFFVRNAFDKDYIATNMASGNFLGLESSLFGPPRLYGAELRYRF